MNNTIIEKVLDSSPNASSLSSGDANLSEKTGNIYVIKGKQTVDYIT